MQRTRDIVHETRYDNPTQENSPCDIEKNQMVDLECGKRGNVTLVVASCASKEGPVPTQLPLCFDNFSAFAFSFFY